MNIHEISFEIVRNRNVVEVKSLTSRSSLNGL